MAQEKGCRVGRGGDREEGVALKWPRRTTLRQVLMRPPQSVRACVHKDARMHGFAARGVYLVCIGSQAPRGVRHGFSKHDESC